MTVFTLKKKFLLCPVLCGFETERCVCNLFSLTKLLIFCDILNHRYINCTTEVNDCLMGAWMTWILICGR